VGIDLYTQMMEEAMAELKGEESTSEPDTQINLRTSAFIPESYIGDTSLRLAAYKEISSAGDEQELSRIAADLRDRYGPLPEPAENLLTIMGLKIIAKAARVSRIDGGARLVTITFSGDARISPDRIMALLKRNPGRIKLIQEFALQLAIADETLKTASDAVRKCLQQLG